jgi:hypothetical protein
MVNANLKGLGMGCTRFKSLNVMLKRFKHFHLIVVGNDFDPTQTTGIVERLPGEFSPARTTELYCPVFFGDQNSRGRLK